MSANREYVFRKIGTSWNGRPLEERYKGRDFSVVRIHPKSNFFPGSTRTVVNGFRTIC